MPNEQEGNPINIETTHKNPKHSNFDLSRLVGVTPVFGRNQPFYSEEFVPDDGPISIEPSCQTRSYTLKAPFFGDIKKHVAFYQVPLQCILPINWEKIVVNASHGNDVQGTSTSGDLVSALDGVNCVVSNFPHRIAQAFISDFGVYKTNVATYHASETPENIGKFISDTLHFIVRWEMFLSYGSLLSSLGVHYGNLIKVVFSSSENSFDAFVERMLTFVAKYKFSVTDDDATASVKNGYGAKHVRQVLDFMRSHTGPFNISVSSPGGSGPYIPDISTYNLVNRAVGDSEPLNFGRCVAYQLVNAHYYSNDKIDYIYTAELYRQYIGSFVKDNFENPYYFLYNGISVQYDYLSGFYMNLFWNDFVLFNYSQEGLWELIPYFQAIFGYNYSLRYLDYFTGVRPRNLAISGPNTPTNVAVENQSVSVINTTKSLVAQRFLNAVARAGQSIENYSSKVLGKYIAPDWHNPKYLFSFDSKVYGTEVENTGAAQQSNPNSVTSVLRGNDGNLRFTFDIDRHSFVVGVEYYDIRRFYYTTQDRNTMAVDRFDMFIPDLQYIGDQPLKLSELVAGQSQAQYFGYQLKDMQFKQSFDICSGGFVENLPGWLFKFDLDEFNNRQLSELHISPDFIRSKPTEIDDFYLSLTGMSMGSYFHFIEVWNVKVSANRPMVYAPQLL